MVDKRLLPSLKQHISLLSPTEPVRKNTCLLSSNSPYYPELVVEPGTPELNTCSLVPDPR